MKNQNLVDFRTEKELSLRDMATKIGVSLSFYEKIEYGQRTPSYNFLIKFKNAFPDSNTDYIFLPTNHTECVD